MTTDNLVSVCCPDCGNVRVRADVFDGGAAVSGVCPTCKERLYFDDQEETVLEEKRGGD